MPKLNTIYHISFLKGNQTKEESHASPIREEQNYLYTAVFISFVKNWHSTPESFQNITTSDVILCHVVCINDVINNASICGESIKFVTSQLFLLFTSTEPSNMAAPKDYRFLCSITCLCCCKRKCFGVPLHVLKLMSLILVQLNCPVRDD